SGLQAIADAYTPDRPVGNRVNRGELWKIDCPKLRRRFKSIELQNREGIRSVFFHVREIGERLDHVHESVQTERAALYVLPFSRDLERSFRPRIEDAPKGVAVEFDGINCCRWRQDCVGHQRV